MQILSIIGAAIVVGSVIRYNLILAKEKRHIPKENIAYKTN